MDSDNISEEERANLKQKVEKLKMEHKQESTQD